MCDLLGVRGAVKDRACEIYKEVVEVSGAKTRCRGRGKGGRMLQAAAALDLDFGIGSETSGMRVREMGIAVPGCWSAPRHRLLAPPACPHTHPPLCCTRAGQVAQGPLRQGEPRASACVWASACVCTPSPRTERRALSTV